MQLRPAAQLSLHTHDSIVSTPSSQMAVTDIPQRFQDLRLDTGTMSPRNPLRTDEDTNRDERWTGQHDFFGHGLPHTRPDQPRPMEGRSEHAPTPPIAISIPYRQVDQHGSYREGTDSLSGPQRFHQSSLDDFLQNRRPSVTFDPTLRLDSGARQHMAQPLQRSSNSPSYRPFNTRIRPRSLQGGLTEESQHRQRTASELDSNHIDPVTVDPLPQPDQHGRDEPRLGKLPHPLLPVTINELERQSQIDPSKPLTLVATLSPPAEGLRTSPHTQRDFLLSPLTASPIVRPHSYEPSPRRSQTAAADFLHRNSLASTGRLPGRRSTCSSTKSPRSAASSFLASFSASRRGCNGNGTDFDARPTSPDAEGQTVGDDYVLGKQIGFGGFSVVKEALHMRPDGSQRKVAVKIVRRSIKGKNESENEQAQAEFDHEVELWRFLRHPRILPLEAVYKTSDATFCFTPLNTGGTLFDLVRANRSGLAPHLAKRYSYQLATAIRYLHEDARVAHRDIKLENCLLDTSAEPATVRVCDFGMAEWISSDSVSSFDGPPSPTINSADRPPQRNIGPSDTSSSSAFAGGSLEYAAPEIVQVARSHSPGQQREVERGIVSPASDIWALGVCVYTLAVGSRPFQDAFQPRVVMAILEGDWDQERLRDKGGEDALELVAGCLEKDVHKRWNIDEVLGSAWLSEEVEQGGDQDGFGAGAWSLA